MQRRDMLENEIQACAAQAAALANQSADIGQNGVALVWAHQAYDVLAENMFAAFCEHLLANPTTAGRLFDTSQDMFAIDAATLRQQIRVDEDALFKDPAFTLAFLATAQK